MELTKQQLKSIAKGVLEWEYGPEGGLIPHRFSAFQREVYSPDVPRSIRAHASAGIRLECCTDASSLEISLRFFPGSAKDIYGLDLTENGQLLGHLEGSIQESDHIHWCQPLSQGEKIVVIYLPCLTGVEILGLTLKGASVCSNVKHDDRILFMGDSITQGYTSHFPSITYPALVAAHHNSDLLNQGIGGEVFRPEILAPLDWDPTLAIIAYGTNDWARDTREEVTRRAGAFLDRFCDIWPNVPTVVLSPIWRVNYHTRRKDDFHFSQMQEIFECLAARHPQITVIPGSSLFPPVKELLEDAKIHPNELGFAFYAKRLTQVLDSLQQEHAYRKTKAH